MRKQLKRVLVLGASGSGTSTVGMALAELLDLEHLETDELFWLDTFPPFIQFKTGITLKNHVQSQLYDKVRWVLSGSPCGWADDIVDTLDLVIFLIVPTELRIERIKSRDRQKFGRHLEPGGIMYQDHLQFLAWTAQYDTAEIKGNSRSRKLHENWLTQLACPVLRLNGSASTEEILKQIELF